MAGSSRETFKKRQKELLRLEKQRDKAARRMARKSAKQGDGESPSETAETVPEETSGGEHQPGQ
jgi:hypothetical protein